VASSSLLLCGFLNFAIFVLADQQGGAAPTTVFVPVVCFVFFVFFVFFRVFRGERGTDS
jgi:lipopolysaccharide export LptBFGC system permease protein LptF